MERRDGGELRAEGRRLVGTVLRYSDFAPTYRERFEPGALFAAGPVPLNIRHDPMQTVAWSPDGGLELHYERDALRMVAELPPIPAADVALRMVRDGYANGLSAEFHPQAERREAGLRVIERARLSGIALTHKPAYRQSRVEARARLGSGLRATMPTGRRLDCQCHGSGACQAVEIEPGAFDAAIRAAGADGRRDILAVAGSYHSPLASVRRGTLAVTLTDDGYRVNLAALPDSTAGRDVVAAAENTPLLVRPIFDEQDDFEGEESDGVLQVRKARLKAVLVGPTDRAAGWPEAEITEGREAAPEPRERRRRLWL